MKKILIVEDDRVVSRIYQSKLQVQGYDVFVVADGLSAIRALQLNIPDLVLLDLRIPGLDGVEVLKSIRANPATRKLPVIVLSNAYLTSQIQAAWKAGATKCLTKADCTPRHLLQLVSEVLAETKIDALEKEQAEVPPDSNSQADLRSQFQQNGPALLNNLRHHLQQLTRSDSEPKRQNELFEMQRVAHSLGITSAIAGVAQLSHFAEALEAFIRELYGNPSRIQASILRTLAQANDLITELLARPVHLQIQPMPQCCILGVDDDVISRKTLHAALEKARLKVITVDSGELALQLLQENRFDLIFTDMQMPGMDGAEFCKEARKLPTSKKTPIVFATGIDDLQSRMASVQAGGTELISKPYMLMEVALKAMTAILRNQPKSDSTPAPTA